jgi:hypothetical protein
MWTTDADGNIVWVEGATRSDVSGDRKVFGFLNPGSSLAQQILESRAAGQSGFTAPRSAEAVEAAKVPDPYVSPFTGPGLPSYIDMPPSAPAPAPAAGGTDDALLSFLSGFGGDESRGYAPSLVDTSAAEAMFRLGQTPEERAALERLLQDLDFRAEAATDAVRSGWSQVQQVNSAAAAKAAQMARDAGPEAARLWTDAANTVLNLSSRAAEVLGSTPGMQRVNISPTAGSEQIAALLAAEAPRARQLAERMGLASSEQIAAQARTAGMMGEAYAGDIQRTALIQANSARQEHNQRVLDRTNAERQAIAQMRFQAASTNAQLLTQAAAAAAAGARTPDQRREQIRGMVSDVREFANIDPQGAEPRNGISALMGIYGMDADVARNLILRAREGTLDWATLMAEAEG